ncbi:MAG TPA: DEAD/DEAH box helicase [Planctomycetota bacterium]|nr:DEAD/DEAH box helicase [Planctomycetota bacterium]
MRLLIKVAQASPWPSLKVSVQAELPSGIVPLRNLQCQNGCFTHQGRRYRAEALDGLLLRTLLQQPTADDKSYLIGARDFASVLALLRQCSDACNVIEDERVSQVEILSSPAQPVLEIVQAAPSSSSDAQAQIRVLARVKFRCPESTIVLGVPLYRGNTYWTFARHISPVPELPEDSLINELISKATDAAKTYSGNDAFDLIARAKAAAKEGLALRLDEWLSKLNPSGETLKTRVRVTVDKSGELCIEHELVTPDGTVLPREALPAEVTAAPVPVSDEEERARRRAADDRSDWIQHNGRAYRLPQPVAHFRLPQRRKLSDDAVADFISDELPRLKAAGAQLAPEVEQLRVCQAIKPAISVTPGESGPDAVQAQWCFETVDGVKDASEKPESIAPVEILAAAANGQRYLRRGNTFVRVDREAVIACKKQLEKLEPFREHAGEAKNEQIPELLAWAQKAAADVHTPWNVYVTEAVDGAHKVKDQPASVKMHLDVEEDEGEPWFTLNASFDHGGEELSEDELREMVKRGQKWFLKGDTWIKVDADALKKFDENVESTGVQKHRGRARKFYYRFKPAARERVTEIFSLTGTVQHAEKYRRFLDQLRGFNSIEKLPCPKSLTMTLRSYQQQGFEWLAFLAYYGLNGILADDMGLGKTAQTIAAITRMKEEQGSAPCLIVTPTSLVDNWRNECAKFSPTLKVMIYRGSPQRRDTLRQQIHDHDVVIGTYGTMRNDASVLRELHWRYVIIDEAHFIKNSAAATTKAIKTIPARHRLALTGTPIQNRLTELWSLFDFLMPDFLGRQMRFRDTYEDPIARMQSGRAETKEEQENGEEAAEKLRERIKPFVLRRLKTDVASELPPKIENDIFCSLSPEQVALYKSFADSAEAKEAVSEMVAKGIDGACTAILAALTSLRKICNHPDLMCLPKNAGRQYITDPLPGYEQRSGKLEALGELLQQCREGGHRALIFCQQTTMMDILAHYLNQMGMKHLRIDGEVPGTERQGLVNTFNADTSYDAFLISTRAGGAGLNLTGADTVIFYDHDWNPANDQQAQDRAYRIGQKKTVNVYRLICKGTLEEKILRRQNMKKMLASSIVQHDVSGVKDLTREELLSLFTLSTETE